MKEKYFEFEDSLTKRKIIVCALIKESGMITTDGVDNQKEIQANVNFDFSIRVSIDIDFYKYIYFGYAIFNPNDKNYTKELGETISKGRASKVVDNNRGQDIPCIVILNDDFYSTSVLKALANQYKHIVVNQIINQLAEVRNVKLPSKEQKEIPIKNNDKANSKTDRKKGKYPYPAY